MRASKAKKLRELVELASGRGLTDEEALLGMELFPWWTVGGLYAQDQRVRWEGDLWRCLTAHTAQADWTPPAAPGLWARVLLPDTDMIPDWIQPDSTNPYSKGDKVRHSEQLWESTIDNNVWEPGVYGWEVIL